MYLGMDDGCWICHVAKTILSLHVISASVLLVLNQTLPFLPFPSLPFPFLSFPFLLLGLMYPASGFLFVAMLVGYPDTLPPTR